MWDFTPKGIVGAFQRGYYKYVSGRKEASLGFLWCWQLTCFSAIVFLRRNSNMSGYASATEESPVSVKAVFLRHLLKSEVTELEVVKVNHDIASLEEGLNSKEV
eukprot:bmy_18383T0